jgi:hypothetical protein
MAALSRDELIELLTDIVHAARARLPEARIADGLKAAEMLVKMCGWNEPERVNVQSVEVKVDAALIEQLRAGYAQLGARERGPAVLDGAPITLAEAARAGGEGQGARLRLYRERDGACPGPKLRRLRFRDDVS